VFVKDMKKNNNDKKRREMAVEKVATHLCLTLIIKEMIISVERDRVVTTLNIIFSVVLSLVTILSDLPRKEHPDLTLRITCMCMDVHIYVCKYVSMKLIS
jgi:hypothetical protein